MSSGGDLLDSKGNPIKQSDVVAPLKKVRSGFRSIGAVLAVLVAGGLITAVVAYRTSENTLALERERFAYEQAQNGTQLSVEYWLGPNPDRLTDCLMSRAQSRQEHGEEGARQMEIICERGYVPDDYQTFELIAVSEVWPGGASNREEVECVTEQCETSRYLFGVASVYAVIWNDAATRAVDIEVRWAGVEKAAPVESRSYAKFVDLNEAQYRTERIGDLAPGEGIILPVAAVLYDYYGLEVPRYVIPAGPARFPISVRFSSGSSLITHEIRTPAETTRIVDNGSRWVEQGG